ncbi:hypothetical protein C8J56DRAFT_1017213 [Mycena floridula]|nr:hypothetical protein C8J56DRAFT_1017213 [Mycena floridula]
MNEPSLNDAALDSEEEEIDWEEIQVPEEQEQTLEITLQARPDKKTDSPKQKGISHAERILRIDCHKFHTVCLLANARVRNKWVNDPLLHARLLSLTPLALQNSFAMIHKSRVPEQYKRGRMFETAMTHLVEWWFTSFFEVLLEGHIRNKTFDTIQSSLQARGVLIQSEPLDLETLQDILDEDAEIIRSEKSLMKHALMRAGSRDISAQLFIALCRGLGIPARLVVSLQSVPWQASIGKPKPKYSRKGKEKATEVIVETEEPSSNGVFPESGGSRLDGAPVEKSEKTKGKEKAKPVITLRKSKNKGHVLGKSLTVPVELPPLDPTATPPVFWCEVFSRPDSRWISVDPLHGTVNKPKLFDPSPLGIRAENRMVYVVAFEEDGYGKDVTRRYARDYAAKVVKEQGGSNHAGMGGKGRQAWWNRVISSISRPYRLNRDDVEDEELDAAQIMEGMPTTINGFKDHPLYVLTRHLKQNETIHPAPPATPQLGKFRGEPVYPRSSIVSLKTPENWLRSEGRVIKEGVQPLKSIKLRTSTVGRQRELEVLKEGLREAGQSQESEVMQGLYARSQTESYQPAPVVDGVIPKNDFGNIDLYVKSMLPAGAVHLPFKGVGKIAKKLGLDYAEAVTGFEFKKRRAFPIVEGVVVAQENEQLLLEAYIEAEQEAQEAAQAKREERALKRWTKLIHGLRVRQRLLEQYAGNSDQQASTDRAEPNESNVFPARGGGGFLVEADDVVQAFHLPRAQYDNESDTVPQKRTEGDVPIFDPLRLPGPSFTNGFEMIEDDDPLPPEPVSTPLVSTSNSVPKSMNEMAEMARLREQEQAEMAKPAPAKTTKTRNSKPPRRSTRKRGRNEDEDEDEEAEPVLPSKRARAQPTVLTSGRTLRPRASKNYAEDIG